MPIHLYWKVWIQRNYAAESGIARSLANTFLQVRTGRNAERALG